MEGIIGCESEEMRMKGRIGTMVLLAIAAAGIAAGLMMDQQAGVMNKAIQICLECVGLG